MDYDFDFIDEYKFISNSTSSFMLTEKLGEGSYGDIYNCRNLNTDRLCVAKAIKNEKENSFEKEYEGYKVLKQLNCENIIKVFDFLSEPGGSYVIMEKLDIDLNCYMNMFSYNQLDVPTVIAVAKCTLNALHTLRNHRIIHLDLRPENIMIVDRDCGIQTKLIDFGLSQQYPFPQQGELLQLAMYRAPEIYLGAGHNEAVDMWSLGVTLIELLIGEDVFGDMDIEDKREKYKSVISDIRQWIGDFPKSLLDRSSRASEYFTYNEFSRVWNLENKPPYKGLKTLLLRAKPNPRLEQLIELFYLLLEIDPKNRITPELALYHPVFRQEILHLPVLN